MRIKKIALIIAVVLFAFTMMPFFQGCAWRNEIVSARVIQMPDNTIVLSGNAPDLTGGYIEIVFRSGRRQTVSMTDPRLVFVDRATPGTTSMAGGLPMLFNIDIDLDRWVSFELSVDENLSDLSAIFDDYNNVELTFRDEFNGFTTVRDNWEFQIGAGSQGPSNPWGNRELQFYTDGDNFRVENGRGIISGRQEDIIYRWLGDAVSEPVTQEELEYIDPVIATGTGTGRTYHWWRNGEPLTADELYELGETTQAAGNNQNPRVVETRRRVAPWLYSRVGRLFRAEYSSTRMRSANMFYQTFGRFEAKMRIPAFPGSWNAFWMMPENNIMAPFGGGWPRNGEIDIMENRGRYPDYVGQAVHMSMGNPGQHRMLFNQDSGQQRLRAPCWDTFRAFTTEGEYHLESFAGVPSASEHPMRFQHPEWGWFVLGDRIGDHYHIYRIDWRPESMVWYIGYIDDYEQTQYHEVFRIDNWRTPSGGTGGWTGWWAGMNNVIDGIPNNLEPNSTPPEHRPPGALAWQPVVPAPSDPVTGLPVGSLGTAYLHTRRETAPFDHNFHMILNMAIGGAFDPVSVWNIPQGLNEETSIDWVRVFQFKDLIPTSLEIVEHPYADTHYNGQRANLAGGILRAVLPDNTAMYVPMEDARLMRYPRVLDTVGINVEMELDFRGRRVAVVLPEVRNS